MKTLLFISVLLFSAGQVCFAQEISKSDIVATVRHMQSLAADQKKALIQAQADFTQQATQLQEQTILTAKFRQEASDNARQRDVVLFAFAIFVGFYVGTLFGGEVMRDFPAPWSLVACAAVYVISGIGAYTFGRIVLASLAHFIP
jgi:hypothetical protein